MASVSDTLRPSPNPNCFGNYKGLLELIGIYSNDVSVLNANFRKWALKYHPDKGGEKDFFSLVTECVRGAIEYLERYQPASPEGFEDVMFQELKEQNHVRYIDDLGVAIHGVVLQLHPPWSPDKTHIVICKTDVNWVPEPQTRKMYICRESIHQLLRKKAGAEGAAAASATATPTSTTSSPFPSTSSPTLFSFENVQWRDLRAGDKIRVTYVNVKNPAAPLTAHGIFRAAPTYSDVVEFVKTDESFNNLSKSFTSLPLTGSMCRFQRLVSNKMSTPFPSAPRTQTPLSAAWAPGSCAAMPTAAANASTKKRKVA